MSPYGLNTDDLTSLFFSTCQSILDTVAPFRTVREKPRVQPWLNATTRAVRLECRRAERRWKKDKLQISFNILKENLSKYQKTVRSEKSKYLSNVICNNSHKPAVLFSTINAFLNTPQATCLEPSAEMCEKFLHFFINKIEAVRANIVLPSTFLSIFTECSAVFNQFELVFLASLREIIVKMKSSICGMAIVPPCLLKDSFETIGPKFLAIINGSLASRVVPKSFKHAVVEPVI